MADLRGREGRAPPLGSDGSKGGAPRPKMFSISCVFLEFLENHRLATPPGGLAPPPMGNPGSAPAGVQILSISCSFWENLKKSYVGAPWRVGTPISGKSWIRHWISLVMSTYYLANVFPKTVWVIFFMTCFHRAGGHGPLGPPRIRYWDMKENRPRQWRIQDFPERGRQLSGGGVGTNIRFCQIFPKTA